MERVQVYLEREQRLRLNALARSSRRPAAELIREAVDLYLKQRAQADVPDEDGLFSLVGMAGDLESATDVSTNRRKYLAVFDSAGPSYKGSQKKKSKPRQGNKRGKGGK